jgi:hypothetical protein
VPGRFIPKRIYQVEMARWTVEVVPTAERELKALPEDL